MHSARPTGYGFGLFDSGGLRRLIRPLRILDAGVGTGQMTQGIKDLGIPTEIIALDRSMSMLRQFNTDHPDVFSVQADFDKLPFADNRFDVVMFGTSLHWGDPDRTPSEVRRVLRPGGALVCLYSNAKGDSDYARATSSGLSSVQSENPMTSDARRGGSLRLGEGYRPNYPKRFEYLTVMTPAQIRDTLASLAGLAQAPQEVQARVWNRAEAFLSRPENVPSVQVPRVNVVHVARVERRSLRSMLGRKRQGNSR